MILVEWVRTRSVCPSPVGQGMDRPVWVILKYECAAGAQKARSDLDRSGWLFFFCKVMRQCTKKFPSIHLLMALCGHAIPPIPHKVYWTGSQQGPTPIPLHCHMDPDQAALQTANQPLSSGSHLMVDRGEADPCND